jgi:hypothetical protein
VNLIQKKAIAQKRRESSSAATRHTCGDREEIKKKGCNISQIKEVANNSVIILREFTRRSKNIVIILSK